MLERPMPKQMLILPTFDGQTKSLAAVSIDALDLIKPAMTPGTTNVYVTGDHNSNCVNVHLDMKVLLAKLKEAGVLFTDLSDGTGYQQVKQNDGH